MDNTDPRFTSICPRCFREVSNKAYFAGLKGSAHFRGSCSPTPCATPEERIPERTFDKPMPNPSHAAALSYVNYDLAFQSRTSRIETYADLAKWWGLDNPTPKPRVSKASKTLAKMGIAA